jgi:hypothetical protein
VVLLPDALQAACSSRSSAANPGDAGREAAGGTIGAMRGGSAWGIDASPVGSQRGHRRRAAEAAGSRLSCSAGRLGGRFGGGAGGGVGGAGRRRRRGRWRAQDHLGERDGVQLAEEQRDPEDGVHLSGVALGEVGQRPRPVEVAHRARLLGGESGGRAGRLRLLGGRPGQLPRYPLAIIARFDHSHS